MIRNSSVATGLQDNPTLTRDQQAAIIAQVTTNWDGTRPRPWRRGTGRRPGVRQGHGFVLAPTNTTARAISDVSPADPDVKTSRITGEDADKASVEAIIEDIGNDRLQGSPHASD